MANQTPNPLEAEFKYYLENRDELISRYGSRYIVIKGCRVVGAYDTEDEALEETLKDHEMGTFIMRRADRSIDPIIFPRVGVR